MLNYPTLTTLVCTGVFLLFFVLSLLFSKNFYWPAIAICLLCVGLIGIVERWHKPASSEANENDYKLPIINHLIGYFSIALIILAVNLFIAMGLQAVLAL